ncbi:hypothetical protein OAO93_02065 [Balneolaceae bacterium]|nr:hypothetical protein [Balneolaceae bacterium]
MSFYLEFPSRVSIGFMQIEVEHCRGDKGVEASSMINPLFEPSFAWIRRE